MTLFPVNFHMAATSQLQQIIAVKILLHKGVIQINDCACFVFSFRLRQKFEVNTLISCRSINALSSHSFAVFI